MRTKLANRFTVTELVRIYNEACARIREGYAIVQSAENLLNETFTLDGYGGISAARHSRISFSDPPMRDIEQDVWRFIIERLEIRRMMSNAAWETLQQQLKIGEFPEITEASVNAVVTRIGASLNEMLAEAVEEVFDWLRPRHSQYKRNSEYEVPARVVLQYIVEPADKRWTFHWRMCSHADQRLTALENVFTALDGQGQITKTHYSAIATAIRAEGYAGVGETPYFKFRTFQNGNAHLTFTRLDLLARFNAIAGGRRLRAGAA